MRQDYACWVKIWTRAIDQNRGALIWPHLRRAQRRRFKKTDKVNVFRCACYVTARELEKRAKTAADNTAAVAALARLSPESRDCPFLVRVRDEQKLPACQYRSLH